MVCEAYRPAPPDPTAIRAVPSYENDTSLRLASPSAQWALRQERLCLGTDPASQFSVPTLIECPVTVVAVARAVSAAVVEAGALASDGVATELSSDVTSLPDLGVSYDPAFESPHPLSLAPSAAIRPRAFAVQGSSYLQ